MFKSESRWDRHLPSGSYNEEPISVGAVFKDGKVSPRWFIRQERKYYIKNITYEWIDKRGSESLFFFALTDGTNVYQIYFNNKHLYWRLYNICENS